MHPTSTLPVILGLCLLLATPGPAWPSDGASAAPFRPLVGHQQGPAVEPAAVCLRCAIDRIDPQEALATALNAPASRSSLASPAARASGDPLWNGLLIGTGAGFALGLINQGCTVHSHCIIGSTVLFAGVGLLVDALR